MTTIEVLEPAGDLRQITRVRLNPARALDGLTLAVLDNLKPNFRLLATLAAEKLRAEHGIREVLHFSKDNAAVGARPEVLDEIARSADLVLTGSAD